MAFSRDFYYLLCGEEKGLRGGGQGLRVGKGGGGASGKKTERRGEESDRSSVVYVGGLV